MIASRAINRQDAANALSTAFCGEHAWCAERMMLRDRLQGAIPAGVFFRQGGLEAALERLASHHGSADRRVLCSFWSLYYFAGLTIPLIVAERLGGQALPARLDEMALSLSDGGLPGGFGLAHAGKAADPEDDGTGAIIRLIDDHLGEVVEHMHEQGISRRLCWNNAAVYIDYALRLCSANPPAGETELPLFRNDRLPDGRSNPFCGLLHHETDASGAVVARRKLCCLRYRLPAIGGCGAICALPCQRTIA